MTTSEKNTTIVDPVCGLQVDPETAVAETCHNGTAIYFCSENCKTRFLAAPDRYINDKPKGLWRLYLDRLNKATGGRAQSCH